MELRITAMRTGRLSSFLRTELSMSVGLVNRLKWGDALRVNGVPCFTNHAVQCGDVITVLLDEETPEFPAEDGALNVLFEDEYLLAVDKPEGMLIHPSRSKFDGTLANFVAGYYEKTGQHSAFHPLTRLDRDTFGIVLLAKNAHIHAMLQRTRVQKTYYAVVYGEPPSESGIIDAPIARKPLPSLLREIREDGKPSRTCYRVTERRGVLCKVELEPLTGRTHQLRVHMAHIGTPIIGDPQYASEASMAFSHECGVVTQLLCAKRLEFVHPITGAHLTLESAMDAEFPNAGIQQGNI